MNVFGLPMDEITKLGGEIATGLKAARTLFSIMPPGQDKGAKNKQKRQGAYLGLLVATGDLMTWHIYLGGMAVAMQRWEPFAFRHTTTAIYQTADARKAMSAFLAALSEIRLVGNPEPRAAAEEITAALGELFELLPTAKRASEREQQIARTGRWMLRLGEAQKDFILAARRDLGFAKKLRTHRWEVWRPRTVEEWPGGWPRNISRHQEKAHGKALGSSPGE
ncbi:hypothetical protein HFP15_19010 [Amycolatopsis sp. K13G38]|uniref:Uncharacterized protein n=1 Tax=Amycolatopsis acididurans TaxID=2724524 RepID=A0ABX1J5A7_9PSEU|nr:hypothetical protein [Amycolatopsis acididurans]NKQ54977.1 hypothetical protein [Amycolatopsis acididurans]